MSTDIISFHDPKTGRFMTANLKSARIIDGVVELTYGVPYDVDGEVVPTPPALESALVGPKVAEPR